MGDGRIAAYGALAAARDADSALQEAVARAAGHAVGTSHMADHSLGAALFGMRAVALAGGDVREARGRFVAWIPPPLKALVLDALVERERHFQIWAPPKRLKWPKASGSTAGEVTNDEVVFASAS